MSYAAKYIVPFRTIDEILCEIRFDVKGYTGVAKELIGGGDPIKIEVDTSDILTPIRSSSATISVYGSDYLQDLYTSDPFGIKVTLIEGGSVKWLGYVTPDTFSQNFTNPEFIYEIECISALSVLKNKEFDLMDGFVSFLDIIKSAKHIAGFSGIFITNSIRSTETKLYNFKVSASNFYDELEKAMTYYEVLEEIAKYLGCTFTPYNGDLYLIDYAGISKGYNSYSKIEGDTVTTIALSDSKTVEDYKGTGATISRIAGKNKATVNCSLYEIDQILPEFDDKFTKLVSNPPPYEGNVNGEPYQRLIRSYSKEIFEFYKYHNALLGNYVGSSPASLVNGVELGAGLVRTAYFPTNDKPSKLNLQTELFVRRSDPLLVYGTYPTILPDNAKLLSIKSRHAFYVHPALHFCINFQTRTLDRLNPYTADGKVNDVNYESEKFEEDGAFQVHLTFRVGEYYYNGDGWQETETTFPVNIPYVKGSQILDIYRGLDNTNDYLTGLGELDGYVFKAPDFIISGDCELTLHSYKISNRVPATFLFFKDISVTYAIPNEDEIYNDWGDARKDVIYENIIDDYIEEADEIDLKICTNVEGILALSSVIVGGEFLKKIDTDSFGTDIPENILLKRVVELYKQPRFVINPTLANNLKPYSLITDSNLPNVQFINGGGEEDVKMGRVTTNLIQI